MCLVCLVSGWALYAGLVYFSLLTFSLLLSPPPTQLTLPPICKQSVYATIKGTVEKKVWKPEAEEQFEDSLGNVLDKKTYEALLRQGLL